MSETKTRTRRVTVPEMDSSIYADDYDEPGTKAGHVDTVIGYDCDRNVWLVYTDDDKIAEVKDRTDGGESWDLVNKLWEPKRGKEKGYDKDYWDGAPELIGKWLKGEV